MEKKKIETFEDLRVWQKGIELVKNIYLITKEGELSRDFGLRDQLRRASVSVPTQYGSVKGKRGKGKGFEYIFYPLPLNLFPEHKKS